MSARFTAWLSDYEREMLDTTARKQGASANFIMRLALRQFLGMDIPDSMKQMLHVTSDTERQQRA